MNAIKISLCNLGGELDSRTVTSKAGTEDTERNGIKDAVLEILDATLYLSPGDSIVIEEVEG